MDNWTPPRGYERTAKRPPRAPRPPMKISDAALAERNPRTVVDPFVIPVPAPGVMPDTVTQHGPSVTPQLAMDAGYSPQNDLGNIYLWATAAALSEGLGFLGFPYLSQLLQRPEYRRIVGIRAQEATRKWIKLHGADDEKLAELDKALTEFKVQSRFRELAEHDGAFGRAQLYIDLGDAVEMRGLPLLVRPETIRKGKLRAFKTIEPVWSYPGTYNSTDPMSDAFYKPTQWYVMGQTVHASRLLTIVGQEVPDILKPAYQFGGLPMTQMAKAYVDNWIRTRQSVSDIVHSFSVMVLKTNMSNVLTGGGRAEADRRAQLFTSQRDNNGLFQIDKEEEEFANVSASLASLDKLLAMSQEQIASVCGIPLVVLLGVTPSGLNASSDGEIAVFHADIHSYQERVFRDPLTTVLRIVQLHLWGAVDDAIKFDFVTLDDADEVEESTIRKTNADTDAVYVNTGVLSADEIRERIAMEDGGLYNGVSLSGKAPGLDDEPDVTGDMALDVWNENDHERDAFGRFTSSGHSSVDHEMRNYVLSQGDDKGVEHLTGYDYDTGHRFEPTSGREHNVKPTPEMTAALSDRTRKVVLHHNHPGPASLSRGDLLQVTTNPGMKGLYAHSTSGSSFYAEKGKKALTARGYDAVDKRARELFMNAIKGNYLPASAANHLHAHFVAEALHDQGKIKYGALLGDETKEVIDKHKGILSIIRSALK